MSNSKPAPDWERIELDYRAGIKTLRQIAEEHGITHGAINKRAKRDGWERDLSEKIHAKADALVSRAAVSTPVSADTRIKEQAVVDANAHAVADVRLAHRRDIHRARRLTNALLDELERQTDPDTLVLLEELGELLKNPDEKTGRDRLNEVYQAVISLPERSKTMKVLAESLQKLVDMERQAFGMNDKEAAPVDGLTRMLKAITGSGASAFQPVARDPEHDEG
ncbi:hypothetical protein QRO08_09705 [Paracidovorax citrulli]|uniref:Phage protein n=2 Tax=Paracidovorax citrulli TaxID=80869 RepID=A1TPN9_PARC0|nr:hypothetical protein [Paracidovorax citrulli]ABM32927.1 hypothetical protein Aave_2352 [Paracidovorax citrulli AAC00-1]ATG93103.1 hypothetical protein CQB05_02790 [Paracidovorax citrulli]PVY67146.1 hypothetical protein C8E08_4581 [Paracidovorax citrulli]REG68691.1 hypothetical protein C8E07_1810 [Paracidovorax citrulli]RLJ93246.1 hypothetical protein C8E06_1810 [Paracidovorax citrulli]